MQTATKEVMTENRDRQISYRGLLQPKFSHLVERNGGAATGDTFYS